MPLTVSDAGPLIHLAQITQLHLLRMLFKHIMITPGVKKEVVDQEVKLDYPDAILVGKAIDEGWISVKAVSKASVSVARQLVEDENIAQNDAETLMLARENGAENLLVDEKILSDLAKMYGFRVWSTWTILLEALSKGFIEHSDIIYAINELGKQRHKLKAELAREILEMAERIGKRR